MRWLTLDPLFAVDEWAQPRRWEPFAPSPSPCSFPSLHLKTRPPVLQVLMVPCEGFWKGRWA